MIYKNVEIKPARDHDLPPPQYESDGAACFDLRADLSNQGCDSLDLIWRGKKLSSPGYRYNLPKNCAIIDTGFCYSIPSGFEMQIRPRSSKAIDGLHLVNSPATIDSDYRGEACLLVAPRYGCGLRIEHGERIAQAKLAPVYRAEFEVVDELDDTERGEGRFGSTGSK